MYNFIKNTKERFELAALLMAMSVVGIPCIPFIPAVMLVGGWRMNPETHGVLSIANVYTSFILTLFVGSAVYVNLLTWFVRKTVETFIG